MDIKIRELQILITNEKKVAEISMFGAFRDGFISAWDILNTYLEAKQPKCVECKIPLSEEEIADGDVCNSCYKRLQAEHNAEQSRDR